MNLAGFIGSTQPVTSVTPSAPVDGTASRPGRPDHLHAHRRRLRHRLVLLRRHECRRHFRHAGHGHGDREPTASHRGRDGRSRCLQQRLAPVVSTDHRPRHLHRTVARRSERDAGRRRGGTVVATRAHDVVSFTPTAGLIGRGELHLHRDQRGRDLRGRDRQRDRLSASAPVTRTAACSFRPPRRPVRPRAGDLRAYTSRSRSPSSRSREASRSPARWRPTRRAPGSRGDDIHLPATRPGRHLDAGHGALVYTAVPVTANRTLVVRFNGERHDRPDQRLSGRRVVLVRDPAARARQPRLDDGPYVTYTPVPGYFGRGQLRVHRGRPRGQLGARHGERDGQPARARRHGPGRERGLRHATRSISAPRRRGVASSFLVTQPPLHGTVAIAGNIATYTPNPGFAGADTFRLRRRQRDRDVAAGAGEPHRRLAGARRGDREPHRAPERLRHDRPRAVHPGSSITGCPIAVLPAHGLADVNGTKVTYTPRTDLLRHGHLHLHRPTATRGPPQPVVVTVTVDGRPDPSPGQDRGRRSSTPRRRPRAASRAPRSATSSAASNRCTPARRAESTPPGTTAAPPRRQARRPHRARGRRSVRAGPAARRVRARLAHGRRLARRRRRPALKPGRLETRGHARGRGHREERGPRRRVRRGCPRDVPGRHAGLDGRPRPLRQDRRRRRERRPALQHRRPEPRRRPAHQRPAGARPGPGLRARPTPTSATTARAARRAACPSPATAATSPRATPSSTRCWASAGSTSTPNATCRPGRPTRSPRARATQFFGSIAAGYELRREGLLVSPYGRLDFTVDKLDQATETGAGPAALSFHEQTLRSTQAAAGIRVETRHETDFGWTVPRARLEYRHEFEGGQTASISYADLVGGLTYSVTPAGTSRNSLLFGVGADFLWRKGLRIGIDYQGERTSNPGHRPGHPLPRLAGPRRQPARLARLVVVAGVHRPGERRGGLRLRRQREPRPPRRGDALRPGLQPGPQHEPDLPDQPQPARAVATALLNGGQVPRATRASGAPPAGCRASCSTAPPATSTPSPTRSSRAAGSTATSRSCAAAAALSAGANARRSLTDRIDVFGEVGVELAPRRKRRLRGPRLRRPGQRRLLPRDGGHRLPHRRVPARRHLRLRLRLPLEPQPRRRLRARRRLRGQATSSPTASRRPRCWARWATTGRWVRATRSTSRIGASGRRRSRRPDSGPSSYNVNQYSILYLMRF